MSSRIEDFSFRTDGKFDMEKCVAHLKRLAQVTIQLNPHVRVFYTVEYDNQSTRIEWFVQKSSSYVICTPKVYHWGFDAIPPEDIP